MDLVKDFEKVSKQALRIAKFKSAKRQYTAMTKLYPEWQEVSKNYLMTNFVGSELLDAYTNLDMLVTKINNRMGVRNDEVDTKKYMDVFFDEFAELVSTHTDRMFFNVWIRCQLCFTNALSMGHEAFCDLGDDDGSN